MLGLVVTCLFFMLSPPGRLYQGESRCWNSSNLFFSFSCSVHQDGYIRVRAGAWICGNLFFSFSCSVDQDGYMKVRAGAWISGNLFVFHAQSTRTVISG